RIFQTLEATLG
ncbi:hypothetical protein D030_2449B, partial [Vibrio parahaemolyticus AQ3810]